MKRILLIGGTDPSGAGLQTDFKIVNTLEGLASSVVTAVTAQNNQAVINNGVLPYDQIKSQFDALGSEQFAAIKIGMLGNERVIKAVIHFLSKQASDTVIIVDPVLSASSGHALLNYAGKRLLLSQLLPFVTLLTPNIDELKALTGLPVNTQAETEKAGRALITQGAKAVLVKGGHTEPVKNKTVDTFIMPSAHFYLAGERWKNRVNVRGTGCALATAIAVSIAKGYSLVDALVLAKAIVSQGIKHAIVAGNAKDGANATGRAALFHFNQHYSGQNFSLAHLPKLMLSEQELQQRPPRFSPCDSKRLGIYPVVDSLAWIKKLVPLGVETIQLRIKDKPDEEVEQAIIEAITFCKGYNTRLFVNDYWQLAVKHKAYGIHLGQEDLQALKPDDLQKISRSGCRLGLSTHSYAEVARAHAIKPSYLALGPIFETTSKDMPWIPQGVAAVEKWVKLLGDEYPLVAIGGIDLARAKALKETGVGSVAMISAITEASDYVRATEELLELWSNT